MKFIILILTAVTVLAADDIAVTTVTKTNGYYGTVTTKEYFTRAGQTNLQRSTTTYLTNGVLKSRSHFIYYHGQRVSGHISSPSHGFTLTQSDPGFGVSFETSSNILTDVTLSDRDGNLLDWYIATNGVLTPIPSSELRKYVGKPREKESDDK